MLRFLLGRLAQAALVLTEHLHDGNDRAALQLGPPSVTSTIERTRCERGCVGIHVAIALRAARVGVRPLGP